MKFLVNWTIDLTKLPTYRKFRGEFSEELDQQLLLQLSQKKKDYHKDTLKDLKNEILYQMKTKIFLFLSLYNHYELYNMLIMLHTIYYKKLLKENNIL